MGSKIRFEGKTRSRFFSGMRRRLGELRRKTEDSLEVAIDTMMLDRVDSYFRIEEGLGEIERMTNLIEEELDGVDELTYAQRMDARLEFIEDRFEDFDSEIRERPKRRRRKINLFDFFNAAGGGAGGSGDVSEAKGEIRSHDQAYEALGLEYGSSMVAITRAFRERAKKLHPDIRNGDQSLEPQLRRIIEAYQWLRADSSIPRTEAHGTENSR